MLGLPQGAKIYFCSQAVDFRKGFDGLSGIIESKFEMNVLDGHLFLFVNRRGDRVKALWWEPGGLILWYKRLEQGTFAWPDLGEIRHEIYALAASLPGIAVTGIDMHIGSQIVDLEPFDQAFSRLEGLVRRLRAEGHAIEHVDLGGGGVPHGR